MEEDPKRATDEREERVHDADPDAKPERPPREAEDERASREPGRRPGQLDTVGRTADDAVQDDHVCRVGGLRILEDVGDAEDRA